MDAMKRVAAARSRHRPTANKFIRGMFDEFTELHGDRCFGDDAAVVAGIARIKDLYVTVVALERGETIRQRAARNFGSAHPEGYRKALRLMKQAEKFGRPVVTLIDTSGAYCGIGAEERGQGQAIATNLMEMMALSVPILSIVIGEGGSGGALGLAVADEVWMLENAVYSVISPEGCASILWKDASFAAEAADCLKLTAEDLVQLSVAERIFPERGEGFEETFGDMREAMYGFFIEKKSAPTEQLLQARYEKFRSIF